MRTPGCSVLCGSGWNTEKKHTKTLKHIQFIDEKVKETLIGPLLIILLVIILINCNFNVIFFATKKYHYSEIKHFIDVTSLTPTGEAWQHTSYRAFIRISASATEPFLNKGNRNKRDHFVWTISHCYVNWYRKHQCRMKPISSQWAEEKKVFPMSTFSVLQSSALKLRSINLQKARNWRGKTTKSI